MIPSVSPGVKFRWRLIHGSRRLRPTPIAPAPTRPFAPATPRRRTPAPLLLVSLLLASNGRPTVASTGAR